MTFSIPQPIPSRSSHPVQAHHRPSLHRAHSHTIASATASFSSPSNPGKNNVSGKYGIHHILVDNVGLSMDHSTPADHREEEDDQVNPLHNTDRRETRHDSGHYPDNDDEDDLDMSVEDDLTGIPISKTSYLCSKATPFGTAALPTDPHRRQSHVPPPASPTYGRFRYSHSHSNSDGHSSINLLAHNTKGDNKSSTTPANDLAHQHHQQHQHPHIQYQPQPQAHTPFTTAAIPIPKKTVKKAIVGKDPKPSSFGRTGHVHPNISVNTSKECLQRPVVIGQPPKASKDNVHSLDKDQSKTAVSTTSSGPGLPRTRPEGQLSLGLKKEGHGTTSSSSSATATALPSSSTSTRPLTVGHQSSRFSSALPPTPSSSLQLDSQSSSSVLLPSLSPSSPKASSSALVSSLEQLSVSWKAPEQTPSFPINRLNRSRTISSGTRPSVSSYFSAIGPSGSSNSHYQNSLISPSAMVTSSSYSSLPYSPAVAFLSNFVDVTAPRTAPDEEGEQVGDFIMGRVIGHGGFSVVREAFAANLDGLVARVAVKIVKTQTGATDNDRVQRMLDKEIAIWSRLSHRNVLPFLAVEKVPESTFVFCELCTGGHLLDYITAQQGRSPPSSMGGSTGLDEAQARAIFNQIAEAVRYLHEEKRIVHRDIKLENILQHEDGTWKICDFGLAEYQNEEAASYFGSPLSPASNGSSPVDQDGCSGEAAEEADDVVGGSLAYCSPEQLRSQKPLRCPSSDVWSLGVVLYALLTGRLPFQDEYEPRLQYQILNSRYEDPTECSAEARELLKNMFRAKPDDRWRIGQVMDSPWCMGTVQEASPGHPNSNMSGFFSSFRA